MLAGGALAGDPHRHRATAMGGYTATAVPHRRDRRRHSAWRVGVLRAGWIARGLRVPRLGAFALLP